MDTAQAADCVPSETAVRCVVQRHQEPKTSLLIRIVGGKCLHKQTIDSGQMGASGTLLLNRFLCTITPREPLSSISLLDPVAHEQRHLSPRLVHANCRHYGLLQIADGLTISATATPPHWSAVFNESCGRLQPALAGHKVPFSVPQSMSFCARASAALFPRLESELLRQTSFKRLQQRNGVVRGGR